MSDSHRGHGTEVGLKRWLVPAAAFAVVLLSYGVIQHGVHYYDAASNAAYHARDAQSQIAEECRVPLIRRECTNRIEQTRRENQRNEYDLYAQQAVALWTAIMGAMAVIGVALSGVGIYLIWRTWDATREAADNSRKTLDAFKIVEGGVYIVSIKPWSGTHMYGPPEVVPCEIETQKIGNAIGIEEIRWGIFPTPEWPEHFPLTDPAGRKFIGIRYDTHKSQYILGFVRYSTVFGARSVGFRYQIVEFSEGRIGEYEAHYILDIRYMDASDWPET